MPGTKLGCGEGGCGACTVMASKFYQEENKVRHSSINACLTPIGSVHGLAITTVEGIGSINTRLHPVQERLSKSHGSQCGFCTPGFVMSMYTLLRNNPKPSMQEIEENLVGNLCRCTGYRPILEGFRTFSAESANTQTKWLPLGCGKSNCCQVMQNGDCELQNGSEDYLTENGVVNGHENGFCDLQHHDEHQSTAVLFDAGSFIPYDPSQEIIFPPELKLLHQKTLMAKGLTLRSPRMTFHLTTTLERLLELKDKFRDAKIVIGNTEIGVELKYKNRHYPVIINPLEIQELLDIKVTDDYVEVGAAVTLSAIEDHFRKLVNILEESKVGVLVAILKMLERFGGKQIRNVACLGGNIMTGSPISDLNPIFLATGVILKFRNVEREREVKMDENFYIGYRKVNASDNDVLISVKIPYTAEDEYFMAYKQSRRRDDDIAIVNSAMKVKFKPESDFVDAMSLVYGGMAETTIVALRTMKKFEGRRWNRSFLESVTDSLIEELQLDPSAPGGMTQYRMTLCSSFFLKFYLKVRQELERKYPSLLQTTDGEYAEENEDEEEYIPTKSLQFYQNVPVGQEVIDPFGRPLAHSEAIQHVTGEATYTDDIPKYANELFGALVLSSRSYAKIISIDPSEAIRIEGVAGFFCSKDLPGKRNRNPRFEDEEVFASETVTCLGQVIGLVVAEDETTAQTASKLVKVAYEDLQNPIISIEDAIEAKSFFGHVNPFKIETGDLDSGFTQSDHVLEGELRVGGQEHFYLETHCIVAIPHENKEMEVICSSQDLTTLHKCLSNALGVPQNRVRCRVRKIGGGFGGKETRGILSYVPIAVAASKLRRPVRMMLDRQEDMLVSGTRNPFLGKWKVGFTANGSIKALEALLYLNAGCSVDLSADVMAEAVTALQNSYRYKKRDYINISLYGWIWMVEKLFDHGYFGNGRLLV